jgi:hypothetical protein
MAKILTKGNIVNWRQGEEFVDVGENL